MSGQFQRNSEELPFVKDFTKYSAHSEAKVQCWRFQRPESHSKSSFGESPKARVPHQSSVLEIPEARVAKVHGNRGFESLVLS